MNLDPNFLIHDEAALRALYGEPGEASIVKEKDHITPEYRALIAASPFAVSGHVRARRPRRFAARRPAASGYG